MGHRFCLCSASSNKARKNESKLSKTQFYGKCSIAQVGAFMRSLRKCLFKFNEWPHQSFFVFIAVMEVRRNFKTLRYESSEIKIFHTFGLALLSFFVLPHLDSVKGLLVTSAFGLGPLSKFKQLSIRN